jgi:N,N'-diacetyllegionaminate synthase
MRTIIIAEAGVNHNGDMQMAMQLIDVAAEAGADYVKFQSFRAETLVSKEALLADYQQVNTKGTHTSQYEMLKQLELSDEQHVELKAYSNSRGISFLSTGFDEERIAFLCQLGIDFIKVPSGEITNKPYLQFIASRKKPVVLSTGMATLDEIRAALAILYNGGLTTEQVSVLHCNTEYPTPMQDVNLRAMLTMQNQLGVRVGYSDHTEGIEVSLAAVSLGASIIEKHFTLDKNLPGPDHRASLEPNELKELVKSIRSIELALSGNGAKHPSPSETKNISIARKSIHLKAAHEKEHVLQAEDLIMKRPGDGISPMDVDKVIGCKLKSSVAVGTKLTWQHLH